MILEIFLLMQLIALVFFLVSYFVRNELMWALTILFSTILAMNCLSIQYNHYVFNVTTTGYDWSTTTYNYPFLMWAFIVLVAFSLLFFVYDVWENYLFKIGAKVEGKKEDKV